MSILVNAYELSKSFGLQNLFSSLSFSIESSERIGLIGPNGAGKSTLLKILAGIEPLDGGNLSLAGGLKIAFLEQVPSFQAEATVFSTLQEGMQGKGEQWEIESQVREMASKLELSEILHEQIKLLSGGQKKRVALGRELIKGPDLFLLDEPTNHLDVESIMWLERFLAQSRFATLIITHDRLFLQRVSNHIMELDRRLPQGLMKVKGDYLQYLTRKEEIMEIQQRQEDRMRNTLRRETDWLRSGVKARGTKQRARIQRAHELAEQVDVTSKRNMSFVAKIDFQEAEKNPKKLIELKEVSKAFGEKKIIPAVDFLISPKTRLGLLGNNGCGKTTLIKILSKNLAPDTGSVLHADDLKIAYFEQNRESLDVDLSLEKCLCPQGDHVDFRGNRVHIKSYLSRFLFRPEQMEMPVYKLSGGEQSRLLIARLMLIEANVLVLDEPTNDLDMATLDVLESVLSDFNGAVILVSHDRYFLDQVSNTIISFERSEFGEPELEVFSDIRQWEAYIESRRKEKREVVRVEEKSKDIRVNRKKKKFSFKEQQEWDSMEESIFAAEEKLENLTQESQRDENLSNATKLQALSQQMGEAQAELDRLYARWSELEKIQEEFENN